jgi:hypothetical protein
VGIGVDVERLHPGDRREQRRRVSSRDEC